MDTKDTQWPVDGGFQHALEIATHCHKGQSDKAGKPYIEHPTRVADRCETEDEKIVALLHDTMEDCGMTADRLQAEGFPAHIVDAVCSVTRNKGEDYFDFIRRCAQNPIGCRVKMHDLEDNMDILRFVDACPYISDIRARDLRKNGPFVLNEEDLYRLNKYLMAYQILRETTCIS